MTTLAPALSLRYFPRMNVWMRDFFLVFTAALFVAVFAQVKIPLSFTPIPLTGQTFAVLLVGAILGSKRGATSLIFYIAMGAFGLPFFAGGASGFAYLSGATLGYLFGFVAAAYLVGKLAEQGLGRSGRTSLIPFLAGTLVIYLFGVGWMSILFGIEKAIGLGVLPFLIGDAIKLILAALTLPTLWKFIRP